MDFLHRRRDLAHPTLSRSRTLRPTRFAYHFYLRFLPTPRTQRPPPCLTQIIQLLPPFGICDDTCPNKSLCLIGQVEPCRAHTSSGSSMSNRGPRQVRSRGQLRLQRRRSRTSRRLKHALLPISSDHQHPSYRSLLSLFAHSASSHIEKALQRMELSVIEQMSTESVYTPDASTPAV